MSGSPSILYTVDGTELTVSNGSTTSANKSIIIAGSDGANNRFIKVDPSGNVVIVGSGTSGTPAGGVLSIQGVSGGTSVPISGTITANIGTSGSLALDATLTGGTQKSIVRGGAKGATAAADVTSTSIDANTQALHVSISGTPSVTISSGTTVVTQPTAANLNATVTPNTGTIGNAWFQKITDGTNTAAVKAASTAAIATDPALVVAISPNNSLTITGNSADNSTNSTTKLPVIVARANTSAPTWTDGNQVPLSVDTSGALRITGSISASNPSVGTTNSAIPTSATLIGGSDGTNIQAPRVYDLNSGAGSEYTLGMNLRQSTATGSVEIGTNRRPLTVSANSYGTSAFGEMRIAQNYTLADYVHKYEIDPNDYSTSLATGGTVTHVPNQSAITLAVTTSNGSRARLRTNTFHRYQAGKGIRVKQSIYHPNTGIANQIRRWGFFDDNDGFFWELNGTNFGIVRRTSTSGSPVDSSPVLKASFNVDPLDGTGPSGITLDITKANIYEINLQWLGVGTVNFYVDGYLVHSIAHANTLSVPYMKTAQLPTSYEIVNSALTTAASFTLICSSVVVEGGNNPPEYSGCAYNSTPISVTTTERPVLTIRPKSTYNSITNRMIILPKLMTISTKGNRASYRLVYNGSLTGASYSSVNAYSGVEFDVAATAITGGETLYYGFLPNTNDSHNVELDKLFELISRTIRQNAFATGVDTLTIMAVNEAAGSTNIRSSIVWTEIR